MKSLRDGFSRLKLNSIRQVNSGTVAGDPMFIFINGRLSDFFRIETKKMMAQRNHYRLQQHGRLYNSQNLSTGKRVPFADTGALGDDPLPAAFGPKVAEPEGKGAALVERCAGASGRSGNIWNS
jgi:hypothetical protein